MYLRQKGTSVVSLHRLSMSLAGIAFATGNANNNIDVIRKHIWFINIVAISRHKMCFILCALQFLFLTFMSILKAKNSNDLMYG